MMLRSTGSNGLGALLLVAAGACGSESSDEPLGNGGTGPDAGSAPVGECDVRVTERAPTEFTHVANCTELAFDTDPPSGGQHYQSWAAFGVYDFPVPPGFLVHSLEHGAVVLWYNCPEGCADEVAQAEAFITGLPADPTCAGTSARQRVILTPSPALGARWAASAWGWTLTASCFDAARFGDFYTEHYRRAREDLCTPGVAVTPQTCG